jgi:sugar lactone lactonase YvrE
MQTPKLFTLLPNYVSTPDGMEIDKDGNLIVSCPNFADLSMPSCIIKIDKNLNITKWFDVPLSKATNEARSMGIAFGCDQDLYIVDNQGMTGQEKTQFQGRILRVRMNGSEIEKVTVVAEGMEHPNGIRIYGDYIYVTQSTMIKVQTSNGKLLSAVYRFHLNDENIRITNTLADKNILLTFITEDPDTQYGVDGIAFDKTGNLYVGNLGDSAIHKITLNGDGSVKSNILWARNRSQLKTTDGMCFDEKGVMYVADFAQNAIAKITPDGIVSRIAQSPDCDGFNGELDQPAEPCVWEGRIIISCFDLMSGGGMVNTAHEMPATMSMLEI